MIVTLPHMGHYATAFKALIEDCGFEMLIPPPSTRKTMELGSAHSPEFTCLPFKINLGNYIEALEQGAEVLLQAGRAGECRYGLYCEVQEQILKDLGYKFKMVNLFGGGKQFNFLSAVKSINGDIPNLRILKASAHTLFRIYFIEEMEQRARELRPFEIKPGSADRLLARGVKKLRQTSSLSEGRRLKREIRREFDAIEADRTRECLRIGIVGELYVVMEPRANLDIERKLGEMGVAVTRPMSLSGLLKHAVMPFLRRRMIEKGKDFIEGELGAHAADSIGHTVEFSREGYDGVIHLYPFTCMPEVSARGILTNVSRKLDIPVLSLALSEQTGEAGLDTRLESFVDMIRRGRKKR